MIGLSNGGLKKSNIVKNTTAPTGPRIAINIWISTVFFLRISNRFHGSLTSSTTPIISKLLQQALLIYHYSGQQEIEPSEEQQHANPIVILYYQKDSEDQDHYNRVYQDKIKTEIVHLVDIFHFHIFSFQSPL